jgi:hypothetical protein
MGKAPQNQGKKVEFAPPHVYVVRMPKKILAIMDDAVELLKT